MEDVEMNQFLNDLSYVILGAFIGWLWRPLWELGKKIVSEAKKAREEW